MRVPVSCWQSYSQLCLVDEMSQHTHQVYFKRFVTLLAVHGCRMRSERPVGAVRYEETEDGIVLHMRVGTTLGRPLTPTWVDLLSGSSAPSLAAADRPGSAGTGSQGRDEREIRP